MKKLLKRLGIGVLIAIVVLIIVIATRPDTFHLERSAQVSAPPEVAFALVNDFHEWGKWSPWEKLDPNMKRSYDGPAEGTGAIYSWAGNDQAGEGRMTIQDSKVGERVGIKLEFLKPFAATNETTFTFTPAEGGTRVTWAMDGKNDFMSKAMQMFMDMDSMVGKDFEKGLASLDAAAKTEAEEQKAPAKPKTAQG